MDKSRCLSLLPFIESISSCFQTFTKADILPTSQISTDLLNLYFSQTNLKENITSSHYKQYLLSKESKETPLKLSTFSNAEGFPFVSYSPKRTFKAILQAFPDHVDKTKKRNTLEIYNQDSLYKSLNLDEYHESVLNNAMVGDPLKWSQNENKLIYLAALKPEKRTGFFDSYNPLDEKQLESAQQNYVYEPDYGEKLNNITKIGIFIYDLSEGTLKQLVMPYEKLFPTNPDFSDAEGNNVLFCGFISDPIKLGILHCINRPSKIFHEVNPLLKQVFPKKTDANKENEKKTTEEKRDLKDMNVLIETYETCLRPLISPNRKFIAYFTSPLLPPHLNTLALHIFDLETQKDECVLPIVKTNIFLKIKPEEANQSFESFSGIAGFYDTLDKMYWLEDSNHLIFQSIAGFENSIFIVNTSTKDLRKMTPKTSVSTQWTILNKDPIKNLLFARYENMKDGLFTKVAFLDNLSEITKEGISSNSQWTFLKPTQSLNPLQNSLETLFETKFNERILKQGQSEAVFWSLETYDQFSDSYKEFFPSEFQKEQPKKPYLKPLIVSVHGGPHGNIAGHSKLRLFMLLRGYNMLLPNFTGSCGYGQNHIEGLMRKIGDTDVEEIVGFIKQSVDQKLCDPERIIIIGGSYGGYLSGSFATHVKYASLFKAAILLNPVVNVPFMTDISDIPEWSPAVSLAKKNGWNLTSEEYKLMYEQSPISGNVKIPCLVILGAKDRRVPYQASLAFRNKALAEGGNVEMFVYPESDHALAESPKVEFDVEMKILSYLGKILDE